MLKKTNILALVGGGQNPLFSKNKITIYDSHQELIIRQIRLNSYIINVKLRNDSIIGFIEGKIYILNINSLETIDIIEIEKSINPIYGLSNNNTLILAFPLVDYKGKIKINKYFISSKIKKKETLSINAHESNIVFITINNNGTLLASGSEKGPYIRLFNTSNGDLLAELKRGKKSKINSISFETNSDIIGYIGDNGKIYIYDINELKNVINNNNGKEKTIENNNNEEPNKIHEKIKIKEKPIAKFQIKEMRNILGFVDPKCIVILNSEGKFYKASYNVKSGHKCLLLEESFLKFENK